MNTINLFHENMKLADMLNENPQLILMLPRFDIRLGFGEKRIREVCEGGKVPVGLFLLLCNVYTFDFYLPTGEEVESIDGKALISYLQASHRYYLVKRLSHIGTHIDHIADVCGDVGSVLRKFFSEYRKEVEAHFSYEEDTVFPYILRAKRSNCIWDSSSTPQPIHTLRYQPSHGSYKYSPPFLHDSWMISDAMSFLCHTLSDHEPVHYG